MPELPMCFAHVKSTTGAQNQVNNTHRITVNKLLGGPSYTPWEKNVCTCIKKWAVSAIATWERTYPISPNCDRSWHPHIDLRPNESTVIVLMYKSKLSSMLFLKEISNNHVPTDALEEHLPVVSSPVLWNKCI